MKTAPWIICAGLLPLVLLAQTDAPPDTGQPLAPDVLPAIDAAPVERGRLEFVFTGNPGFNQRQLREGIARQVESIEEFGLDEAAAYDISFFVESFYRKHGYPQATAETQISGPWRVDVRIIEGPRTRTGKVKITGNAGIPSDTLTAFLLGPTRERFPRIRDTALLPFVAADINTGVELVRRAYAAEGYLDADVPDPTVSEEGSTADISIAIEEGIRYRFGQTEFEGELVFPKGVLLAEIATETAGAFTPGRLAAAQRRLGDFYAKRGYFRAEVTSDGDPLTAEDGVVSVTFHIVPGAAHRFSGVTVNGSSDVPAAFIEKRLRSLDGRLYSPEQIDRRFREMIETGLFRNVQITPEAVGNDSIRLNVTVEEAKAKEFGIGLGFATYDGLVLSLNYTDRNLLRSGRPLTFVAEVTQRGFGGEIVYSDPWFLDSDYRLRLRLYALNKKLKGYSKNEIGFQPSLSRKIGDRFEVSAFLLAKTVRVIDIKIQPESFVGPTEYSVAAAGLSLTYDTRNNLVLPTSGLLAVATFDVAPEGIGSVAFARGVGRLSYYVPVTRNSALAFGARAGILFGLNGNEIPIDERFFNGGATTVRSFSEFSLGPKDDAGYPLGGQGFTVFNVEYGFPIWGDLRGAVFVDAGNVVSTARGFGVGDMRYGVGAGLRYNLPIGALRLDYGLNPSPRPGEAQGAFHFAIGIAF